MNGAPAAINRKDKPQSAGIGSEKMIFTRAEAADLLEISSFYDAVCDDLCAHENYPGWKKGVYPTVDDARAGIKDGALYVIKNDAKIVGTVLLRHRPEEGYENAEWLTESSYDNIYVIYTLAVHPDFTGLGIGKMLLDQAEKLAEKEGCRSIRLDVAKGNISAESLYKKCGYKYVGTVSLGYEKYGLPWYNLYEKVLREPG